MNTVKREPRTGEAHDRYEEDYRDREVLGRHHAIRRQGDDLPRSEAACRQEP